MKINFLTGPVQISEAVRDCFAQLPVSHRSEVFTELIASTKSRIQALTQAQEVILMSGSGTLANEAIAWQLKQLQGRGLILSNGEFGQRLIRQAEQTGLHFTSHIIAYGQPFDTNALQQLLAADPDISWIWMVVHETSVGIWNDHESILSVCAQHQVKLALDGVSAIAVQELDLSKVYLASGVSGKAIAAYPGICFVMSNHLDFATGNIPVYLDLNYYQACGGIPFTINSNLIAALDQALFEIDLSADTRHMAALKTRMLDYLQQENITVVNTINPSPNMITIQLPSEYSSESIGDRLSAEGISIGYKSKYLIERNWLQLFFTRNNGMEEVVGVDLCLEGSRVVVKL